MTNHTKECLQFWKPTVARKITFYFTVFGLLVFYLTSVVYLIGAKKHLAESLTRVVQGQVPRLPGNDKPDFWWQMAGKQQPELGTLAQTLFSLAPEEFSEQEIAIYARPSGEEPWQRLYLDSEEVLRSEPVSHEAVKKLASIGNRHFVESDSNLYVTKSKMALLVDITSPADQGHYFFKAVVSRQGIMCLLGDKLAPFVGISLLALMIFRVIGYFFARRLAKPVEILSDAAAKVAEGDFSPQVPPMGKTEMGTLGKNFNKMIMGLREWQRIKRMEIELEKGREIQQDFLPRVIPEIPNWNIATSFYPAREVSGDFYDVFDLPDGMLGLVIADVCDKGVGSALYMSLIRSLIRVYAEQYLAGPLPGDATAGNALSRECEVVQKTNNYLARHHGNDGMFATLFFGVLDPTSGKLVYVNGGHEPLFVVGQDGVKAKLSPTGPAIGLMEDIDFKASNMELGPGDLLFGLTDGVTEALNSAEERFTRDRVLELLAQPVASARELLERIQQQVFAFAGTAPRSDDLTMLAVQRVG